MNNIQFKVIKTNDTAYLQVVALRNKILRIPLGKNIYDEDLSGEKDEIIFTMSLDNQIVATCQLKPLGNNHFKLRQMAVDTLYQGAGIGIDLLTQTEQFMINNQIKSIELHARTTAVPFYKKLNYQVQGTAFLELGIPHYKMEKTF